MHDRRAKVSELAEFVVGHAFDDFGVGHDTRVCVEDSVHVRPVLIKITPSRSGDDRPSNIRPAARKRLYSIIRH